MSDLSVSVNHRLSQDEGLRRIQAVVAQAKVQYSGKIEELREVWDGYVETFQISAKNLQASGTVIVNPSDVTKLLTRLLSIFTTPSTAVATV